MKKRLEIYSKEYIMSSENDLLFICEKIVVKIHFNEICWVLLYLVTYFTMAGIVRKR